MSYDDYSELKIENKRLKRRIKILIDSNINLRTELAELERKKYAPLAAAQIAYSVAQMALGYGLAGVERIIGHDKGSEKGSITIGRDPFDEEV